MFALGNCQKESGADRISVARTGTHVRSLPEPRLVLCLMPACWKEALKSRCPWTVGMSLKVLGGGGAQPECTCGFSRGPPWAEVTLFGMASGWEDSCRAPGRLQGSWGERAGLGLAAEKASLSVSWVHHTVAFLLWISRRKDCRNQTGG